eukprot:m.35164 g.35164  ORF g.35164 m.35164 type:complete len:154 (+) comp32072_c0_seq3:1523-1984(+)
MVLITCTAEKNQSVSCRWYLACGVEFCLLNLYLVHRDLKPSNVLIWVSPEGEALAKISDFGLAKELKEGKADATQTNLGGSNGWMPPEVFALKINCAFDIFSFGCIIYYVLTKGKHPFDEEQRLPCESKQRFGNAHTRILTGVPPIFTALEGT